MSQRNFEQDPKKKRKEEPFCQIRNPRLGNYYQRILWYFYNKC